MHEYLADFPGKEDELRYVLTSILPEVKDSEFTWKDYQARINNELVAILGNFVNRALVLTHKYFDGKVQAAGAQNKQITEAVKNAYQAVDENIRKYNFRQALIEAMSIARIGNKFLADTEPWKLIKSDEAKTGEILNISLQLVAHLAKIMESFLPNTSKNIGLFINKTMAEIDTSKFEVLPEGSLIEKPSLLFQKIEDEQVEAQVEKLKASKVETVANVNFKPNTTFDDFQKLDLKVAEILAAEKVIKADKLLQLKLNVGGVERNVVSGIAQHYNPEEIIGKKVLYLANLEPRKIRGVVSEGMILMAENAEGELSFMTPEKDFESGAGVS